MGKFICLALLSRAHNPHKNKIIRHDDRVYQTTRHGHDLSAPSKINSFLNLSLPSAKHSCEGPEETTEHISPVTTTVCVSPQDTSTTCLPLARSTAFGIKASPVTARPPGAAVELPTASAAPQVYTYPRALLSPTAFSAACKRKEKTSRSESFVLERRRVESQASKHENFKLARGVAVKLCTALMIPARTCVLGLSSF